jgi:predicted O-linked N-acetylglucosamine transferase (SPINDLY family)
MAKGFKHGAPAGAPGLLPNRNAEFARALGLHQAGHLAEAERLYQMILQWDPKHFDATNLLGMVFLQRGQFEQAEKQFRRAVKLNPRIAAAVSNRGNALLELRRSDEALACYDKALALEPNNADVLNNRGTALLDLGKIGDALASFDRALAIEPNAAKACFNRGNALKALKRLDEAIASYGKAVALRPDFAAAYNNRGNALLELGQADAAAADFDKAIAIDPLFVQAYCNLAGALIDLRRFSDAFNASGKALQLAPQSAAAWVVQGDALRNANRFADALTAYDKASALEPQRADGWFGRARVLNELRRHTEAADCYRKLLAIDPDYEFAKGGLLYEKMLSADWRDFAPMVAEIRADIAAGKKAVEPFCYQAVTNSLADTKRCAEIYCRSKCPPQPTKVRSGERHQNGKIRVGYVSGELRGHVVARLLVELLERHDKSRFELFAFDNGDDDGSKTRGRIVGALDSVIDISTLDTPRAAAAIKDNQIDILVNLNGHYGRSRTDIFSWRAAPVQVNYLGFSGTMGADFMDYILADRYVIPEGSEAHYSEKVVSLPDSFQPSDSKRVIADELPSRSSLGLPERGLVFCCFNNTFKITPDIFDIWMRLLGQIDDGVLWLPFDNDQVVDHLRKEAAARGVAAERLVFSRRTEHLADYFARYRIADLFLDTFPFNAGATANDALWSGLPLLTCSGDTYPARLSGSLLQALGLPELITRSLSDYEALALKLARDRALLGSLRQKLAENRNSWPLFDMARLTRHVEAAYGAMWQRHQAGLPPESFAVERIEQPVVTS